MKIYVIQDTEDHTILAIYFNELKAKVDAGQRGRWYEINEFDTEDEPPSNEEPYNPAYGYGV